MLCRFSVCDNLSNIVSSAPTLAPTALGDILQLATRIQLKAAEMATPLHGSIGSFDSSQEDWLSYTERLQQYFTANDIKNDEGSAAKKRAILLSVCGAETFCLIKKVYFLLLSQKLNLFRRSLS